MALQAKMGYVGFVKFVPDANPANVLSVRVTSADIKLQQEIRYPEVVDNKIDQTIYELGPKTVGGNIAFPLVHEGSALTNLPSDKSGSDCATTGDTLASTLWAYAAQRNQYGRMVNSFQCIVRYADNLSYVYGGCYVNQMTWTITEQQSVNVSCEVIGGANAGPNNPLRAPFTDLSQGANFTKFLAPARVVTWNDARLGFFDDNGATLVRPAEVREFTCMINNGIERYYTMNNTLAPQDIAAKKREISGSLKLMGHNQDLSTWTEGNESRYTSSSGIAFGYSLGANQNPYWATGLYGVVFEIEETSLSTGLFETSTKWRAMGDCSNNFLATKLGQSQAIVRPTASQYGTSTAPAYPQFVSNGTQTT